MQAVKPSQLWGHRVKRTVRPRGTAPKGSLYRLSREEKTVVSNIGSIAPKIQEWAAPPGAAKGPSVVHGGAAVDLAEEGEDQGQAGQAHQELRRRRQQHRPHEVVVLWRILSPIY